MEEERPAGHRDEEFDRLYEAERDGLLRLAVLVCGDRTRVEDAVAAETAALLGVQPGTVKSRVARALARLRELLDEESVDA